MRVMLVGSSGGHLAQLWALRTWWQDHERHWVTFPTLDAEFHLHDESTTWAHHPTTRNIPNLLRNFRLAWRLLRRERPDLIVSTGAGVAVPFFVLGRLFGMHTIYIEVFDRIEVATLSGRLCYRLSSAFLLQWEEQLALYPRGQVIGRLL